MLLSLFNDSLFAPISFGNQDFSPRMSYEQFFISILILFPLAVVVGHLTLRIGALCPLPFIRSDLFTTSLRLIVADIIIETLQYSMPCVPFEEEEDRIELVLQSFGIGCPMYARALAPVAALQVYGYRFIAIVLGIFVGECWMPVALTGGIATGKSTVAKQLVEGHPVDGEGVNSNKEENKNRELESNDNDELESGTVYLVDTDKIGHDILLESTAGNVYNKIVSAFGTDVLDENKVIDRKKLGAKIFDNRALRHKLNRITHPCIMYKMIQKLLWGLVFSGSDITVGDVPLLFEAGMPAIFCLTVVVTCTPEQELQRLMSRNPDLTKEECEVRIRAQMPVEKKASRANIVIDNSGDLQSLVKEVDKARKQIIWRLYGVGFTLTQIVIIVGACLPIAIWYRMYRINQGGSSESS
mmetsp:Transcript_27641/g.40805  ORF Transcript_27641/g.40805 Transcript_27641/m.40805 type:complete len:413 (-) Transcript_27641:1038-2276(-)